MRISGFSFGKNTSKLYYPVKEAVASILPLVDEFVFALGKSDEDDQTRALLESLNSPKIKIIETVWDTEAYPNGMENAHQTDIACAVDQSPAVLRKRGPCVMRCGPVCRVCTKA